MSCLLSLLLLLSLVLLSLICSWYDVLHYSIISSCLITSSSSSSRSICICVYVYAYAYAYAFVPLVVLGSLALSAQRAAPSVRRKGKCSKAGAALHGSCWSSVRTQLVRIDIVAIFCPFSQFSEINISLLSLQTQPNPAPNLFQRGVEYGKYA